MNWLPLLLAEGEQQGGLEGIMKSGLPMILVFFVIMMIFMGRSGARQRREAAAMLANLKKNDKVVTSAGIIGVVVAIKENEDEVTLRVDETSNSRITVLRSSIARVNPQQAAAQTAEKKTT
jgi:preprotein translocase subunit YajC